MDINTCFTTIGDLRSLASYANFVPAAASIILAGFVLFRSNNMKKAIAFASFVGVFSLWLIAAGIIWASDNYYIVAAFWSPIDYFALLFFLLLFCFFYIDIFDNIPRWISTLVVLIASVSFGITVIGNGTFGFDQSWCNMNNNEFLTVYNLWVGIITLLAIFVLGVYRFIKVKGNKTERTRISIVAGSIVLFMGIFLGSEYWSSVTNDYTTELYALFLLPIFILFLTISITSYGTFRLGDTVAKALFYIFLVFSGAQFFFVTTPESFALAVIAFLMTLSFGVLLLQSYERENTIRKEVEKLAQELQTTNERQETLLHFIGHEVKGFLTKDSGAFSSLIDGDFAPLPEALKPFVTQALAQSREGALSVTDILTASNQKKGTVSYVKEPFDIKILATEIAEKAKHNAENKGLTFSFSADDEGSPYIFTGDKNKIGDNVFRNIIDNSINYTPSGTIEVSVKKDNGKFIFAVKDTGIGISEEDKKHLFTEGGHGKDSQKVNVHSTGYGLFIAKNIVEAHGGTIRAESEGEGKGSSFVVEFPVE